MHDTMADAGGRTSEPAAVWNHAGLHCPIASTAGTADENRTNKVASTREGSIIGAVFVIKKEIPNHTKNTQVE